MPRGVEILPDFSIPVKKKISSFEQRRLVEVLSDIADSSETDTYPLTSSMAKHLLGLLTFYQWLVDLLASPGITISLIRKIFEVPTPSRSSDEGDDPTGVANQEPAASVNNPKTETPQENRPSSDEQAKDKSRGRRKEPNANHPGKRGANSFPQAPIKDHYPQDLLAGGSCSETGCSGKVYRFLRDGKVRELVVFDGRSLLEAMRHRLHELRCTSCGKIYSPKPKEDGLQALDGRGVRFTRLAQALLAFSHVWCGLPYHRLGQMQAMWGQALSPATIYDQVAKVASVLAFFKAYLCSLACDVRLAYTDDFNIQINEVQPVIRQNQDGKPTYREGTYTSVVIAVLNDGHAIPIFNSGLKHAGENLDRIFEDRAEGLSPPIIIADRSKVNGTTKIPIILGGCLQHARDRFVKAVSYDAEKAEHALSIFSEVFAVERQTHDQSMAKRLLHLQHEALPKLKDLRTTLLTWQDEKAILPRSPIGEAAAYFLRHFKEITLAFEMPGIALTNNISEWTLMLSHRLKVNSYFFATQKGAQICDTLMSVLMLAAMAHRNPWEYLHHLYANHELVKCQPRTFLPWALPESHVAPFSGTCKDYWLPAPPQEEI